MSESNEKPVLPEGTETPRELPALNDADKDALKNLFEQVKKMVPVFFGLSGADPNTCKERLIEYAKKLFSNPGQFSEDFWDSLFGTGGDGISRADDEEKTGKIDFTLELPDPVRMPAAYSVAYRRRNEKKQEVITQLERDEAGNIHYLDAGKEEVFVRTEGGFRRYPVQAGEKGFGSWDGVLLSARAVRQQTDRFWKCADQTFIRWLGAERKGDTEFLGRKCGLYHAQPGTITFTYQCDLVMDEETGICLGYSSSGALKGAAFSTTEDDRVRISIEDFRIGAAETDFCCAKFDTENISFGIPAV